MGRHEFRSYLPRSLTEGLRSAHSAEKPILVGYAILIIINLLKGHVTSIKAPSTFILVGYKFIESQICHYTGNDARRTEMANRLPDLISGFYVVSSYPLSNECLGYACAQIACLIEDRHKPRIDFVPT